MPGTITDNVTNLTRAEAADGGSWGDIGGGQGSGQNSDLPLEGVETRARRIDGGKRGFGYNNGVTNISGAGTHLGMWFTVLQPALILTDGIEISYSDNTTGNPQSNNWKGHRFPAAEYPVTGGWVRAWVDVSQAGDVSAGSLSLASVRSFGAAFDMGNVGGSAQNCHIDRIDYSTSGLILSGGTVPSPAAFTDISSYDNLNAIGIFDGDFMNGPITLGGENSYFEDQNFAIKAGNQPLAAADWITINVDLTLATSTVKLNSGLLSGIGMTFSGVLGTCDLGVTVLLNAPAITLNSAVTWKGSLTNSGSLTVNGADIRGMTINSSTAVSAVIFNDATPALGRLDNTRFVSSGTGHGLEIGTLAGSTLSFNNISFEGYTSADGSTGNEAVWVRATGGTVTINLIGGSQRPSVRSDGATVVFVEAPKTTTFTGIPNGLEIRLRKGTATIVHEQSVTGNQFAYSYTGVVGFVTVTVGGVADDGNSYERQTFQLELGNSDQTIPLSFSLNPSYT